MNSVRRLRKKLSSQSKSIKTLHKKLTSCTKKLKSKNKPKQKLSKRRRRRIPRISLAVQLQQQVQQLQTVRTNYERKLQLNTTEIKRLTELLDQPGESNVLQQRIDELVLEHERREAEHTQTIQELREQVQQQELTIQQLREQIQTLRGQLDECLARAPNSEPLSAFPTADLQQQLLMSREEGQRIQTQLRQTEQQCQVSIQQGEEQVALLQAQLGETRKQLREKQVEWLNARQISGAKDVVHQREMSALREQLDQTNQQQRQVMDALQKMRTDSDRVKLQLEANLTRVNREYEVRLTKHAVESESLKTQIQEARAEAQRMEQQLEACEQRNSK